MSLKRFFRRGWWDDERARELEAHLAMETDENIARGMSAADARLAALRKLGNRTRVREEIYQMNTIGVLDAGWRDLRYGARLLRMNPGFAAVAILSLALGIGANTAIFQLLNALRLRTLPVAHPEQLAEIRIIQDRGRSGWFSGEHPMLTNPLWERLRDRQEAFSGTFAWGARDFELSTGGESRQAQGLWVSGGFFETLQVRPFAGRLLAPTDDRRGCASPPAVIGYAFWQREYGGSPSALGRSLMLDGHPYDIVGVTPPDFSDVEIGRAFDVAVPLCAEPLSRDARSALERKDAWFLGAIGRLKPDWTIEKAAAHLTAISAPMFSETLPVYRPEDGKAYLGFKLGAFPAGTGVSNLRETYESPLWLLLATTAVVLLVACANLANLMLARASARQREIAVRLALGASRSRIVRQLLAESILIAAIGAGAGAVLAQFVARALVAALATENERVFLETAGDWRVFAFVAAAAAAACMIFGLVPAIRATMLNPGAAMKPGGRGTTETGARFAPRQALVIAQVALSLVLVVGAFLFVESLRNLITLDAGFAQQNLLAATLDLRRTGLSDELARSAARRLIERLRREPGIGDAAQVRNVPLGGSWSDRNVVIDGVKRREDVNFNSVSDRYFSTMGRPLLAGRDFAERDAAAAPRVAIVTESFARVFFGGANPVGRTFQIDEPPGRPRPAYEIVGLARDSKYGNLRTPFEPLLYVPVAQDDLSATTVRLVVRSRLPLASVTAAVAALVREMHPASVITFRTMQSQVQDSLVRERLMAALFGVFGGLAALLATIGVYGVMSYSVTRRRNEIGVRMALGAGRAEIVRMVMREAGVLLAAGIAIGTILALAAGRSVSSLFFGLKPHDPATLAGAVVVLAAVAGVASYIPALRASRLQPTEALREE